MKIRIKIIAYCSLAVALALAAAPGFVLSAMPRGQSTQSAQSAQPSTPSQSAQPSPRQAQPNAQGQSAQPAPSLRNPQGPPPPAAAQISPEETQAYNAIIKELDPAKQLAMVKDFEKKFPSSSLLSDVYFFAANAEEQQNDAQDALSYGEKSLKLRPDNLRSLILVAGLLPLPQALQGTVDQKEQQLTECENDANRSLQLLAHVEPASAAAQAQFDKGKQLITAQVHAALGMAHLQKALLAPGGTDAPELALAEQEFKTAVAIPEPNAQDYYRLGEVYTRENKLNDAVGAFSQAAQLGKGKLIEKYADSMIARIKAHQAQAAKTPQGAPPATAKQ